MFADLTQAKMGWLMVVAAIVIISQHYFYHRQLRQLMRVTRDHGPILFSLNENTTMSSCRWTCLHLHRMTMFIVALLGIVGVFAEQVPAFAAMIVLCLGTSSFLHYLKVSSEKVTVTRTGVIARTSSTHVGFLPWASISDVERVPSEEKLIYQIVTDAYPESDIRFCIELEDIDFITEQINQFLPEGVYFEPEQEAALVS
ncbi:hypothetical protein Pla110_16220 [Polystyrenella longa]|uniref:Uncharacterized protein n=1 Tax=Polystyrenella longa TaxID=2528007 RepID=A0A518CKZ8_9PLAN|nr:hypothetical protein [Polystyrenella longa]QDU79902.1 hypothetical protein Pla110_16220 [Polystyrenella longa]